ncbi:MAG: hypothetical protein O3C67_10385 [Cyanobacteria bacterium]|nr:hypothetical protein [Cyanobacteriota bacterium]
MQARFLLFALVAVLVMGVVQVIGPRHVGLRMLSWLGVEVPGLDFPLAAIPNQTTPEGQPQVLIYGPPHCPPAAALMAALETEQIPYLFRDAGMGSGIDQNELGAVLLAVNEQELSESTAFVLVNGRVLANPSLEVVAAEYRRAAAR